MACSSTFGKSTFLSAPVRNSSPAAGAASCTEQLLEIPRRLLLSSNTLTLFDDERSKLSVPLVRPEDDSTFKTLQVSSSPWLRPGGQAKYQVTYEEPATSNPAAGEKPTSQTLEGLKAVSVSPGPPESDSDRNVTCPSSDDGTTSQSA